MKKILHITPDFNYACGRSKLVFLYLKYFGNKDEYEMHFITNGGDSLERLKELPFLKLKYINFSKGIKNLLHQRKFYEDLKQYIIKNRVELVHTHHRFPELISVRIAEKLNLKTIASAHSFVRGYKAISFKSDKIISVSNSVSNYLSENFGVNREKIITLHNPVEEQSDIGSDEKKILKNELGINSGKKVLLFMGRMNIVKGYDTLMKSFGFVKEKMDNIFLIMCGNVEDKKFRKKFDYFDETIKLVTPNKENYKLYSIADIVILPSREEPFPFVMLEAGMFKKPFIGGKTGGIAEFIEEGQNGLLVDSEDPIELSAKIIYLLEHPDIGKMLGEKLYKKVKEKCDYNNYFSQVERIYNSLLIPKNNN